MTEDDKMPANDRRNFLKGMMLGSAALTGAASGLFSKLDLASADLGMSQARAADTRIKMAFVQYQPHSVSSAWAKAFKKCSRPSRSSTTSSLMDSPSSRCRSV